MPLSAFPVNDTDAANAWLGDKSNHNFREWDGASLEDKNKWAELEAVLSAVTGLKPHSIMKTVKDAISDHLSFENTTARATPEQKHKITEQAASAILQNTNVNWKDASENWLASALNAFAPRAIKQWKKGQNSKGGKPEQDTESRSSRSSKKRRLDARQGENKESRAQGNDIKIQQIPSNNMLSAKRSLRQGATSQSRPPLDLETCMIEVRLDDTTHIRVPIEMVLKDHKRDCSISDIRAEHLDFEKLLAIVSATDDSWDSQTCEMRWGEGKLQIHDGEDFTNAIGVMYFSLEQLRLKPESEKPKSRDDVSMD
jgi:hypothetical protein